MNNIISYLISTESRIPISSNSITNGSTPSLLNNNFTSDEYLQNPKEKKKKRNCNHQNHTANITCLDFPLKENQYKLRVVTEFNLRAPSFGVNDNWILGNSLFNALLKPRPERRSHGLNGNGTVPSSSAIDAQARS